jgi:hypothetical protein
MTLGDRLRQLATSKCRDISKQLIDEQVRRYTETFKNLASAGKLEGLAVLGVTFFVLDTGNNPISVAAMEQLDDHEEDGVIFQHYTETRKGMVTHRLRISWE